MNFFICNRYDSQNDDIYLPLSNNLINNKKNYYNQKQFCNNFNPEKTYALGKYDNRKKSISESIDESDDLQIIEYPYQQQEMLENQINIYNKSKKRSSYLDNIQYFNNFNNLNEIDKNDFENKLIKNNLKKKTQNTCLSNSNYERIIDDKLYSDNSVFDLEDTIKGEDNINITKIRMENQSFKYNNNSQIYTTEKCDNNNYYCKNCNINTNGYNNNLKQNNNFNHNKKINLYRINKNILNEPKSFRKENNKVKINNYKDFSSYNKIIRQYLDKNIKNKTKVKTKKEYERNKYNYKYYKSNTNNKSKESCIKKEDIIIHKNLSGNNIFMLRHKQIKNKNYKSSNGSESSTDILDSIKNKFKKKLSKSKFDYTKKKKSIDNERKNYSTKEIIRQFRHFKRKNMH